MIWATLCKKLSNVTHFWHGIITPLPSPKIDFSESKSILAQIQLKIDFEPSKSILSKSNDVIPPSQKCDTSDNFYTVGTISLSIFNSLGNILTTKQALNLHLLSIFNPFNSIPFQFSFPFPLHHFRPTKRAQWWEYLNSIMSKYKVWRIIKRWTEKCITLFLIKNASH